MADDSEQIGQDEIEELLRQAQSAAGMQPASPPPAKSSAADAALDQSEIEALLSGGGAVPQTKQKAQAAAPRVAAPVAPVKSAAAAGDDVQFLLSQAQQAIASVDNPSAALDNISAFTLTDFTGAPASTDRATLELLSDVELDLKIELGRTHMYLEDVLKLRRGSVVPLDKLAGDPVDIYVNGRLIARGEILVLNDNFCVRVAELIAGEAAA